MLPGTRHCCVYCLNERSGNIIMEEIIPHRVHRGLLAAQGNIKAIRMGFDLPLDPLMKPPLHCQGPAMLASRRTGCATRDEG